MALDVTGKFRYPPPRPKWLQQHTEDIIEPELAIIDAHHHLWEENDHPYLLPALQQDLASGHNIVATVFVEAKYSYRPGGQEALRCTGETEKVTCLAEQARDSGMDTAICAAIIGFSDLTMGEKVADVIEAHLELTRGRLRGLRHSVARDPLFPEGIVLRPAAEGLLSDRHYLAGLNKLAEYGLSYDAMLYDCQIPELTTAIRALPNLPVVLDHYGCIIGVGPYRGKEKETFELWRRNMKELANCDNVVVKLGGMGMIVCGPIWHERRSPPTSTELATAWRPYVETCIELFGTHRCMFESNFPVDKAMYSYPILWNAFKRLTADYSPTEKQELFHDTATRVYRIT